MAELAGRIGREKATLRAAMREVRAGIPAAERKRLSQAACRRVLALPEVRAARTVAVYCALGTELSMDGLVGELSASGDVRLLAPVTLTGRRMAFVPVSADELLTRTEGRTEQPRHMGTGADGPHAAASPGERPAFLAHPERPLAELPAGRAPVLAGDIDVMLVPGLAFDACGMRLGYGAGYYDAWLTSADKPRLPDSAPESQSPAPAAGSRPLLVGACFDEQVVTRVPSESFDRPVGVVVTPTRTLHCFPR
ncbi:MAG: hypothetical protein KHY83_05465 [Coriobacteriia bacterium]|nr:hypothetical protein [Coriobacteriia bacterium]